MTIDEMWEELLKKCGRHYPGNKPRLTLDNVFNIVVSSKVKYYNLKYSDSTKKHYAHLSVDGERIFDGEAETLLPALVSALYQALKD